MGTNWTRRCRTFALVAIALLLAPAAAMAALDTLHKPGATATFANDINDAGVIVGTYYAGGLPHGFVYAAGAYHDVDYPGADWTQVTGIGREGDIVGYYGHDTELIFHGFRRTRDGEFIAIDHGGHWNTMPQDVNSSGVVAGCIHNNGAMFGWVLGDDGFSGYTVGEGWYSFSMYTGVSDTGILAGWFWNTGRVSAFVIGGGGDRTDFDFPGASNTQAWDVNLHGCTVGWYGPSAASSRGFLRHANGAFVAIDVPGATWTRALGVNAGHVVVGAYKDGTGTHGFVLRPPY